MAETRLDGENPTSIVFDHLVDVKSPSSQHQDRGLVAQVSAGGDAVSIPRNQPGSAPLWFIIAGGIVAIFWMAGVVAFTIGQSGFAGLLALPVTGVASLLFVALGPAIFILLATFLIAELIRFRGTARYIGAMAARFADPAKATREDARLMAEAVHCEITRVNGAVEGALTRLGAMEEVLGHHSDAFNATEASARERTDVLINDLRREREAVADLAIVLDQKAADIASAIAEQSKMVVAAADIANAHALDSTKTLDDSAERLTVSAHDAAQGAKVIAAKLDDASGRLSSNTIAFSDARKSLETSAEELDELRERVRTSFAASRDDAMALTQITRKSVEEIQGVAHEGAGIITSAFDTVLQKSHAKVQEVQRDTQAAAERNARQAEELTAAAGEARSALDAYAEVIAKRLEQANEASFSAASWADKTFERLEAATLTLENKLSALPETADAQARDLQDKLRKGLAGLNEAARTAADEAEEIDAGFQARIRQNYELLSDFMLRMGSAADQRGGALDIPSPFSAMAPQTQPSTNQSAQPAVTAVVPGEETATKETPSEDENKTASPNKTSFAQAQINAQNEARSPAKGEPKEQTTDQGKATQGWRWKDVLSGMDRGKVNPNTKADAGPAASRSVPDAPDALDRLVTLFRIHDIDPQNLFSTQVYRSVSHARLVGGSKAMTDIVRLEAKVQVKALASAFDDDVDLREAAINFVTELRQKVDEAAQRENRMHLETHLRTGDGPAYLLIEAALG